MQHRSIYIASIEPRSGSLLVATGIMEMLKGNFKKVAFFRPIIPDDMTYDDNITFMLEHFQLDIPYESCVGFQVSEYIQAYARDEEELLHEALIDKVSKLHATYDFVLIEGYPRDLFSHTFDFDINLIIARNLGSAFIPVLNGHQKTTSEILNEVHIVTENIIEEECNLMVTFVNRCDEDAIPTLQEKVDTQLPEQTVFFIKDSHELDRPTLEEIANHLDAKLIVGDTSQLQRLVYGKKIAAMGAENYLNHIQNGDLVIVPGDRSDIILLSLLSYHAKSHPNLSGIILSAGVSLSQSILTLIEDFDTVGIPLLLVQSDSYQTAIAVETLPPSISAGSLRKITIAKALFDEAVDKEKLQTYFTQKQTDIITPMMFQYRLVEQAKSNLQHIVLPESSDERILHATEIILRRKIARITLLGDPEEIIQRSKRLGIDISDATILDPTDATLQKRFSERFYTLRKAKGLTRNAAEDAMTHLSYFATMMVYEGMADGMVSGATHTTADTIRPALQIIKTKPGIHIVSSVFFMLLETRVLVYGDCAINLDPTAEELAEIAISSAQTAQQFGIEPKVALLSYSTGSSGSGPEVEKVRKATQLAQQMQPDLPIEGPLQYDAAIDKEVARKKMPHSQVAGEATVFIFPDLNTGNNTYKAVQRSSGALAIGPVLQGLRLPVNDLSRGCLIDDIVNTVAITAVQAQERRGS
jgi:phosphate acetyltransferase